MLVSRPMHGRALLWIPVAVGVLAAAIMLCSSLVESRFHATDLATSDDTVLEYLSKPVCAGSDNVAVAWFNHRDHEFWLSAIDASGRVSRRHIEEVQAFD